MLQGCPAGSRTLLIPSGISIQSPIYKQKKNLRGETSESEQSLEVSQWDCTNVYFSALVFVSWLCKITGTWVKGIQKGQHFCNFSLSLKIVQKVLVVMVVVFFFFFSFVSFFLFKMKKGKEGKEIRKGEEEQQQQNERSITLGMT